MKEELPSQLNVSFVSRKFPIKGRAAEYGYLWPLARGLAQKGHRIDVYSSIIEKSVEIEEHEGVRVIGIPKQSGSLLTKQYSSDVKSRFLEFHKERPYNLVYCVDNSGNQISDIRKELKLVSILDVRATQMSQLFKILGMAQDSVGGIFRTGMAITYKYLRTYYGSDRKLLNHSDAVFVSSPQQRLVLERYYRFPDMRIFTVPYGVEMEGVLPKERTQKLCEKLGIPEQGGAIVTISDMTETQEMKSILRAFEKVNIKKPNTRLIIVGHGPKRKDIEYDMYNLALGNKVIFTGAVTDTELAEYISIADVYLNISSRTSGFEPSILEAMGQKKVIIGSEVGALSIIVEDGVDGFLVRPADVQSLSKLLLDIFTGQVLTVEMGDRAARKVKRLFDTEKLVDLSIQAYYKILGFTKYYKPQ